jgi:hypothetical protein
MRSRLNTFSEGPAHVAFWPLTASIFFVVNGAALGDAFVLPDVHAARLKTAAIVVINKMFFMSSPCA